MGGGGGDRASQRGYGKGRGQGTWIERTRDRFEEIPRRDVASSSGDVPEETRAAAESRVRQMSTAGIERAGVFARSPEDDPREDDANEPVAFASVSQVLQAGLQEHRFSSGRRASGFEPQRNTFYVCGRPVQVFIECIETAVFLSGHSDASKIVDVSKNYNDLFSLFLIIPDFVCGC